MCLTQNLFFFCCQTFIKSSALLMSLMPLQLVHVDRVFVFHVITGISHNTEPNHNRMDTLAQ